jgi:hypothetical protein
MFPRLHFPRRTLPVLCQLVLASSLLGATKEPPLFTTKAEPKAQASVLLNKARAVLKADIKDPKKALPQQTLDAFIDVVRLQTDLGDFDAAEATLAALPPASASALVNFSAEGYSTRDWILFKIARARLKNGDALGAARTAARMGPGRHPDREPRLDDFYPNAHAIIREALKSLVAEGHLDKAIEAARGLAPKTPQVSGPVLKERNAQNGTRVAFLDPERDETLRPLFSALTRRGQAARARQVALTLLKNTPSGQDAAMLAIALTQAEIGQAADARKWAAEFFEPQSYTALLGRIASIQARTGDDSGAAQTFAEAERRADTFTPPARRLREDLVVSHAEAGHEARAVELFREPDPGNSSYLPPEPGYLTLRFYFDTDGIRITADETNKQLKAKGTAPSLESQKDRFNELLAHARLQLQHHDEADALTALTEAWSVAFDCREGWHRSQMILAVVKQVPAKPAQADFASLLDRAFEQCKAAEEAQALVPGESAEIRAQPWIGAETAIASWHAQKGDLEKALVQAERIVSSSGRDPVYTIVAPALAARGDTEGAFRVFDLMNPKGLPPGRCECATQLVEAFAQRGAIDDAKKVSALLHTDDRLAAPDSEYLVGAILHGWLKKGDLAAAQTFLDEQKDAASDSLALWNIEMVRAYVDQHRDAEARIALARTELALPKTDRQTKTTYFTRQTVIAFKVLLEGTASARAQAQSDSPDVGANIGEACGYLARRGDMAAVQALYQEASDSPSTKVHILRAVARALIERTNFASED